MRFAATVSVARVSIVEMKDEQNRTPTPMRQKLLPRACEDSVGDRADSPRSPLAAAGAAREGTEVRLAAAPWSADDTDGLDSDGDKGHPAPATGVRGWPDDDGCCVLLAL